MPSDKNGHELKRLEMQQDLILQEIRRLESKSLKLGTKITHLRVEQGGGEFFYDPCKPL